MALPGNLEFILEQVLKDSKIPYDKFHFANSKDSFAVFIRGTDYTFQVSGEGREIHSVPSVRDEISKNEFPNEQPSVLLSKWLRVIEPELGFNISKGNDVKVTFETDNLRIEDSPFTTVTPEEKKKENNVKTEPQALTTIDDQGRSFSLRNEDIKGVIGVKDQAGILAEVILNFSLNEKGNFIGLFGRWGRGKNLFLE